MSDFWDKLEDIFGDFSKYYPNAAGYNPMVFLLAPILGFLFLLFLFLGNWKSITKWFDRATTKNEIVVKTEGDVNTTSIRITWQMDYTNEVDIYNQGEVLYTEFFERGNNHFSVSYQDSIIAELLHYKETGLTGHAYSFIFSENLPCISVDVNIEGVSDSLRWISRPTCLK